MSYDVMAHSDGQGGSYLSVRDYIVQWPVHGDSSRDQKAIKRFRSSLVFGLKRYSWWTDRSTLTRCCEASEAKGLFHIFAEAKHARTSPLATVFPVYTRCIRVQLPFYNTQRGLLALKEHVYEMCLYC